MAERDPYDFSALANDPDFGDDSTSVLSGGEALGAHQFVLSEEQLAADGDFGIAGDDFELEWEAMAAEGLAAAPATADDPELRQLRDALQRLGEGLVDLQLEADEAWLEALVLEDDDAHAPPADDLLGQLRRGFPGAPLDISALFGDADLDDL